MTEEKVILSKATYDKMVSELNSAETEADKIFARFKVVSDGRKEYVFETVKPGSFFTSACSVLKMSYDTDSIVKATIEECEKLRDQNTKMKTQINQLPMTLSVSKYSPGYLAPYMLVSAVAGFAIGLGIILFL